MVQTKYIKDAARVYAEFEARKKEAGIDDGVSVFVGFTQSYAIYVHEVQAHHEVGNWKYLEGPARRNAREYGKIVRKVLQQGGTMKQALVMAGLRLQRDAQKECPVDTGALKASAFTATEEKLQSAAAQAYLKSEQVRVAEESAREASGG